MIDVEQIRLAKGLPPLVPTFDWKNQKQKVKKWRKVQVRNDAEIYAWKSPESPEIPVLSTKTQVISYTHEEYEQSLLNPTWTEEETAQLIDLCSEYHLKWPIIHDRLECDPPKSMEEVKQRYFQVNRLLLVARNEPSASFTFDTVKEASLRTNLRALMSRSPQVIQEEDYLMAEILKFKAELPDWENERDYLYKIISHNAEETSGYEARSQKDRKRGRFAGSGTRRKDEGKMWYNLEMIKNDAPTTGVHTSSSIIGVHYKPAMQLKINAILEEFGVKLKPAIPTVAILETFEQVCTAAHQLIDSRKVQDRIQNDLKIANINRKQIDADVGKKKRPASMGGARAEPKRSRLN